jgi:hypothetical protein
MEFIKFVNKWLFAFKKKKEFFLRKKHLSLLIKYFISALVIRMLISSGLQVSSPCTSTKVKQFDFVSPASC